MAIAPKTWRELLEAVYEINSATNHADFASSVVAGMRKLIRADVTVFQVLDRSGGRITTQMHPPNSFTEAETAYYTAHPEEFVLVAYYAKAQDPRARRLSELIGMEELLKDKYYRTCLARQELKYCLALPITVDATTVVALSFNRKETDFTLRDCELLDAFAPHLRLAWERHENPWAEQRQLTAQRRLQSLGLSPRESETLFWMAEGKQNREIATILGVQLGTVQEYVASMLEKLQQENRHAATVYAIGFLRER